MANVVVPIVHLQAGDLPLVCVQTGQPAATTIKVRSNKARSRLAWLWWLFGPLWFLFARLLMTSRFTAHLPVTKEVATRHLQWRIVLWVAYLTTYLSIGTSITAFAVLLVMCMVANAVFRRAFPRVIHEVYRHDAILIGAHEGFAASLHGRQPVWYPG